MQRKRGSLVPVAEVLSDLNGPVAAIRDASPQALHHFTRFDQVNQLVSASEAEPDLGFMARLLTLCSLPRTNPGNRLQYKRVNGPYTLIMTATGDHKLPYGTLPRLLMAWVSTEAVRTQSPVISLGDSLSEFMRTLGIYSSDGKAYTRLHDQMDRLFNASVRLSYDDERQQVTRYVASLIVVRGEYWWDPKRPDNRSLWDSKIQLGAEFFNEVINHPVPLNMNALAALKRSALGLDFYLWLVYRTFALRAPLRLSWPMLYSQFGADPNKASDRVTVDNFRKDSLRELKKIKLAWPELNYATAKGVLILYPSKPAITPTTGPQRLAE